MEEGSNISQEREDQQVVRSEQDSSSGNPNKVRDRGSKKRGKSIIFILIIIIIVAGLAGGAWYLLREPEIDTQSSPSQNLTMPETRTPTSTPVPTVAPKEDVDRKDVQVQILNGTGIAGEAGLLQGKFEALGYTSIDVDNAEDQDNEDTSITFSKELPDTLVDEITEELEKVFITVKTKKATSTTEYDVVVITGLREGQTGKTDETPTKTVTATPTVKITASPTPN
ncbi:LytR C-terminal domain-containing protein [Candidatus Woesebacteria bacterium]|nr:MAG: LytR C-terminal domain-containing protein [Candidatus Woesebacteria bacterium]